MGPSSKNPTLKDAFGSHAGMGFSVGPPCVWLLAHIRISDRIHNHFLMLLCFVCSGRVLVDKYGLYDNMKPETAIMTAGGVNGNLFDEATEQSLDQPCPIYPLAQIVPEGAR